MMNLPEAGADTAARLRRQAGPLSGRGLKGTSGFALDDDACAPFNLYWDGEWKAPRWWRN
jgi:hypothetical protein